MTGNRSGLHNWTGTNTIRTEVEKNITNMTQYGYFEMRAKMQVGGGIHTAWWLTGFEDESGHSAEIDIFEILGRDSNTITSTKHPWKDPNVQYKTTEFSPENVDLANEFHNYGFEWTEEEMIFYFDGQEYQRVPNDVFYPMTMLISLYEKRAAGSWTGPFDPTVPYPKTFDMDYVRIYKELPSGYDKVEESNLKIVSQDEQVIEIEPGEYEIIENEIKGMPSWVTLRYNDGTDTQQWSKWEPITDEMKNKLNTPGETFTIDGEIMGLSKELVNGRKAKLKVVVAGEYEEIVIQKVNKLKAEAGKKDAVLTWEAPKSSVGIIGYDIYKDGKLLGDVPVGTTEYTASNLRENTIYGFKVITKYSNGKVSKPKSINVRTIK